MKIGVIVHGPNIIDSGYALKLISILKGYGNVKARLGGTMGRTAVIDASLEDVSRFSGRSHRVFLPFCRSRRRDRHCRRLLKSVNRTEFFVYSPFCGFL